MTNETETVTDIENGLTVAEWQVRVSRRELLHREWISDKVLLYSTGNCSIL